MVEGTKRKVGRPRAQKSASDGPAKDAILLAAAQLFGSQGYGGTSTREIADKVGIRQPSLFYHFAKKEDILYGIVDRAGAALLEQLPAFEKGAGRAAAKLYGLMKTDYLYLMTEPYGIGQLMLLPALRTGELRKRIERKRRRIMRAYRNLIRQGIEDGDFDCSDVSVATYTVFGMGEAVWTWYRPSRNKSPASVAEKIADMALRSLLRDPSTLDAIKREADAGS